MLKKIILISTMLLPAFLLYSQSAVKINVSTSELCSAAESGNVEQVGKLIKMGGSTVLNATICAGGGTPLHVSVSAGNIDVSKLLVQKGSNINMKNAAGLTPLDIANAKNDIVHIQLLKSKGAEATVASTPKEANNNSTTVPTNTTVKEATTEPISVAQEFSMLNGEKYIGTVANGKFSGQGTYLYNNGDKYVGQWANGMKNGTGTYSYSNGNVYNGTWVNGVRQGKGTMTFKSGNSYQGNWDNGKFSGNGVYTFKQGYKYVGPWLNGKFHGKGSFIFSNGYKYVGVWSNGKLTGPGNYYAPNDKLYYQNEEEAVVTTNVPKTYQEALGQVAPSTGTDTAVPATPAKTNTPKEKL